MVDAESSDQFPGDFDGMGRLWTPHRMVYLNKENARRVARFASRRRGATKTD